MGPGNVPLDGFGSRWSGQLAGVRPGVQYQGLSDPVTYKVPMLSRGTGVSEERPLGTGTPVCTETNLT